MVAAAICNIPSRVEVSRLRRQPVFPALSTRNFFRSVCPDGVLISPKNDPTKGMGAGLSSPYGRSFTSVGFNGTVFPALMASYVVWSMVFAVKGGFVAGARAGYRNVYIVAACLKYNSVVLLH